MKAQKKTEMKENDKEDKNRHPAENEQPLKMSHVLTENVKRTQNKQNDESFKRRARK